MSGFAISVGINGQRQILSDFDPSTNNVGRYSLLGIHGCGIVNKTFVSDFDSAEKSIVNTNSSPEALGSGLRGSIAILVKDLWHNRVYLLNDPFGACMIQHFALNGIEYYSSDLDSLKRILSLQSISLKKNIEYIMSIGLVGNGGLVQSPYSGVSVLKPFQFVQFDAAGARVKDYPNSLHPLSNSTNLDDAIEGFLEDISINLNAVSRCNSAVKISQITGGMDSRMVMGGLIASDLQDNFRFFVGGDENSLDVISAKNLCNELDLNMTRYSGVDRSISPAGIDELTWPLIETNGVLQGSADPGLSKNSNVILSGGYGEILRSFYGKSRIPDLTSELSTFKQVFGEYGLDTSSKQGFWNNNYIESSGKILQDIIRDSDFNGIRETAQLDYLYVSTRNRYFVGEISRSMSSYVRRFDPLYSPHLLSILSYSSMESRHNGELQVLILDRLSRDLVEIPFDTPRISRDFATRKGFRLREPKVNSMPNFDDKVNRIPIRPAGMAPLPGSTQLKSRALEINMPYHALRDAEFARQRLKEYSSGENASLLSEYVNVPEFQRYLNTPIKWKPQIRFLRRLGAHLAWFDL